MEQMIISHEGVAKGADLRSAIKKLIQPLIGMESVKGGIESAPGYINLHYNCNDMVVSIQVQCMEGATR